MYEGLNVLVCKKEGLNKNVGYICSFFSWLSEQKLLDLLSEP